MGKERLMAFTDAVLAIVMTILALELERPAAATLEALWEIKESFFAYALSFFWLGTMWVNIHEEWHGVSHVSRSVVWWNMALLFFSSLVPFAISFVNVDYHSGVAQGFYGIIVLLVSFANGGLGMALEKIHDSDADVQQSIAESRRRLCFDIIVKVLGFIAATLFYPPAMMAAVLITMVMWLIPSGKWVEE